MDREDDAFEQDFNAKIGVRLIVEIAVRVVALAAVFTVLAG